MDRDIAALLARCSVLLDTILALDPDFLSPAYSEADLADLGRKLADVVHGPERR